MFKGLKQRVYETLELSAVGRHITGLLDLFLAILITLNVIAVILETVGDWGIAYRGVFYSFEVASVAIFTIEFLARLWVCTEDRSERYRHPVLGRIRYLFTPFALIDLIAILPFYLSMFIGIDLRFLRVFRLLRILKLSRYSVALEIFLVVMRSQRAPLLGAAFLMLVLLVVSSSLMYMIEGKAQPEAFASIPHAMWWGLVTLTTVGYGDVAPITAWGKVVGGVVTILGLLMYALPAGIVASGFIQELRKRDFVVNWRLVAKVPLFSELDAERIAAISSLLQPRLVPERHTVLRRGEFADGIYFIISGQAEVDVQPSPVRLQAGDHFGEISVLYDRPCTATVTSMTECRLLIVEAKAFRHLLEDNPDLREEVRRVADQRLAAIEEGLPAASDS